MQSVHLRNLFATSPQSRLPPKQKQVEMFARLARSAFSKILEPAPFSKARNLKKLWTLQISRFGLKVKHWRTRTVALALIPPVLAAANLQNAKEAAVIQKADVLYNEHSYQKLYDLLFPFQDSVNADVLWRLARAAFEVSKVTNDVAEEKKLVIDAFNYVQKALELDETNFAAHKWMFILLDKKSSYDGLKSRIAESYNVKRHIERACELNPRDGTSWHLLGYWCYSVSELPWYQRQIASALFATPPSSTFNEALKHFLKAEEVEPNFYSTNLLMIGKTYLKLGDKLSARAYLERARDFPTHTAEDVEVKKEAADLLSKL